MNLETMVYYLIIVNVVGFLVYFLNYMLRTHTKGKQINILIYLISLAGGAAGMLAAVLLFDRKAVKENMMSRVWIICMLVIQVILFLLFRGQKTDTWNLDVNAFLEKHKILTIYLGVINIVTFFFFAIDKYRAVRNKSRIRIVTLLGMAFAGGTAGALPGIYLLRHKTKKNYFTVGVPLMMVMQVLALFYAMNTGW
ncbi:MAG: DUF1294 domain-containing protein [Lachnospiraceae bacterium]|nr:DUF1294 domain-containing protein [Lachnospiraceae bacterium]